MKKYGIISIVFLLLSTLGAIYLVKHNQDIRNRATDETCSPVGQKLCQKNTQGKNTGFQCECIPFASQTSGVWRCTTKNLSTCPTESGSTDATSGTYTTGCVVDGVVVGTITGRCITAVSGKSLPQMWKYKCPGRTDLSGGCQENEQIIAAGSSSVCFENNFCGSQQIDGKDWDTCFMSVVDNNCVTPTTKITKPSSTPTPKLTSTPTPGPSSTPTLTPTITPTPTPGPSSTPTPTSTITPTPTPGPSSTPTVTPTGPTPTRIILPQSGVEFPSQILTIVGGIVTLLGFLILL